MIFEILICLIILILGLQFPKILSISEKDIIRLRWLWAYHLLFGIAFYFYTSSQGGSDSLNYWNGAKHISGNQVLQSLIVNRGTTAMFAFNYIPSSLLDLSFFTGTILYCFVGFMGLNFFYKLCIDFVPYNYKIKGVFLFPAILYFPNLHFWSVSIGKDTISFFCIGLFAFALLNLKKRILLIILSLLLTFIARPHIALFLVLAFSMAYLLNSKMAMFKRVFLFFVLLGISFAMLPSVMEYSQMKELSIESYGQFSEKKIANLTRSHTGSKVAISSYPLPIKIFTFLYRPTIIDIDSALSLLAAIENIILLILSVIVLKRNPVETFRKAPFIIKGLLIFLVIGTIAFSLSLGNMGIMLRMRNMFLPGMLIFICWSYSYSLERRIKLKTQKAITYQYKIT